MLTAPESYRPRACLARTGFGKKTSHAVKEQFDVETESDSGYWSWRRSRLSKQNDYQYAA
jgi:hypothetical protein